jgi:hypothetical protein
MINERLAAILDKLGSAIKSMSLDLTQDGIGLPVRIDNTASIAISIGDINKMYPYTAKTLAAKIKKEQNWVARAAEREKMKDDRSCCCKVNGARNKPALVKYSEVALDRIRELASDTTYNPYR